MKASGQMLSQSAIYALRALGYLAKNSNGFPILASEIADKMQIPQNFLSKIMNRLVQQGYLKSRRGINGGFALAKPSNEITMLEIASLFMNTDDFNQCFFGQPKCDGSCGLHNEWKPVIEKFIEILGENTIEKIL